MAPVCALPDSSDSWQSRPGVSLAIVLSKIDKNGEKKGALFVGLLTQKEGEYVIEREGFNDIKALPDWLNVIAQTPETLKNELLNMQYMLQLEIEEDVDEAALEAMGFKWPK